MIEKIYRWAVGFFAAGILGLLFVMSIISTCFISSDTNEITFFCGDNPIINLLSIAALLTLLVFANKKGFFQKWEEHLNKKKNFLIVKIALLSFVLLVSLFWIHVTKVQPAGDQLMLFASAYRIKIGNMKAVIPGGYLEMFHNQIGLTIIEYYFSLIFGDFNTTVFHIANCIGLTLFYKKLVDIMDLWNASKVSQIITLIYGIIFFPLLGYSTFAYGTIISIALALVAFYWEYRYLTEGKIWKLIISTLAFAVGYQVKSNILIVMIAMVIYAIAMSIKHKEIIKRAIVYILLLAVVFMAFNKLALKIIYDKTGYTLDQGSSAWSFIAMGFQESDFAPGWYNAYNMTSYLDNNCNTEKQAAAAKENLAERMNVFKSDKHYAYRFFSQKIASMWNEPSYESIWITQAREHNQELPWLNKLLSASSYTALNKMLNFLQLWILVGCILWLLLEDKKLFLERSFFVVCFVGGFLFHLMWEAKSQYSLNYIMMMLPIAILGFGLFLNRIKGRINKLVAVTLIAVGVLYLGCYYFEGSHCLEKDNDFYELYLNQMEMLS